MATSVQKWQPVVILPFELGHVGPGRTATLRAAKVVPPFVGGELLDLVIRKPADGIMPTALRYNGSPLVLSLGGPGGLDTPGVAHWNINRGFELAAGDVLELDVWSYGAELLTTICAGLVVSPGTDHG